MAAQVFSDGGRSAPILVAVAGRAAALAGGQYHCGRCRLPALMWPNRARLAPARLERSRAHAPLMAAAVASTNADGESDATRFLRKTGWLCYIARTTASQTWPRIRPRCELGMAANVLVTGQRWPDPISTHFFFCKAALPDIASVSSGRVTLALARFVALGVCRCKPIASLHRAGNRWRIERTRGG